MIVRSRESGVSSRESGACRIATTRKRRILRLIIMSVSLAKFTSALVIIFSTWMPHLSKAQDTSFQQIHSAPYYGYFDGHKDRDSITKAELLSLGEMLCSNRDLKIVQFNLMVAGTCYGGKFYFGTNKGSSFTAPALEILQKALPGSVFFFDAIVVKNKVGRTYYIKAFWLSLKH